MTPAAGPCTVVAAAQDTASPEHPVYRVVPDGDPRSANWMVICDEGWRVHIVCTGMYDWAAEWLTGQVQGRPYAPEARH